MQCAVGAGLFGTLGLPKTFGPKNKFDRFCAVTTLLPRKTASNHLQVVFGNRMGWRAVQPKLEVTSQVMSDIMATQHAAIDAVERDFASAQLDALARAYQGRPWVSWKQSVLEWHLGRVATARSEAWIPGLADSCDPVVKKALGRFYSHHMAVAIKRLRSENMELQRKLLEMTASARSYAGGEVDAGERASSLIEAPQSASDPMVSPVIASGRAPFSHMLASVIGWPL
ncbi:MAG TPA: hypothetical protein VIY51_24020 [Xanthobacteraceae bacterium]